MANNKKSITKEQFNKIKKILDIWEVENLQKIKRNEVLKKYLDDCYKEIENVQKHYQEDIELVLKLNNVKGCENCINRISKEIPKHIIMEEVHPSMKELVNGLNDEKDKEIEEIIESAKYNIPKEMIERRKNLQKQQEELNKEAKQIFEGITNFVYPFMKMSKNQWSFLWDLTNWKFNTLLSKRLERYTFWVMILTVVIVLFSLIQIIKGVI